MSLFLNYSEGFLTEVCHSQLQLQLSFSGYSTVGIWHHFMTQWLDFTFNKAFNILKVLANENIVMPTTLYSFFPYNWKLDLWHYSKNQAIPQCSISETHSTDKYKPERFDFVVYRICFCETILILLGWKKSHPKSYTENCVLWYAQILNRGAL